MKSAISIAAALLFFGSGFWMIHGTWPAEFWIRASIFAAIFVTAVLIICGIANAELAARRESNNTHALMKGYRYRDEAPLAEWFADEGSFPSNSRLESVADGSRRNATFSVGEISYEIRNSDGDGASTTHFVTQTVVMLPGQIPAGASLSLVPCVGIDRAVQSFLGTTGSATLNVAGSQGEAELISWLQQHYHLGWIDDAARARAEAVLQFPVIRWLREHAGIAFEIVGDRLFVWRPRNTVAGDERDSMVDAAQELAAILSSPAHVSPHSNPVPAIQIQPPVVANAGDIFWRLAISGFGSWAIACIVGVTLFVVGATAGWMEASPLVFFVTTMVFTFASWIGSGIAIFLWLNRPATPAA